MNSAKNTLYQRKGKTLAQSACDFLQKLKRRRMLFISSMQKKQATIEHLQKHLKTFPIHRRIVQLISVTS